ncbi:MAG: lamin tail domain-containing protein, partial [Planctomycetota bacterium]
QGHLVQGNYEGRLSSAGEQVQLLDADGNLMTTFNVPDTRTDIQKFLRVSELNYNPTVADDGSEFIEVTNISSGPDAPTLDISGVVISDGPSSPFVFPDGTTLAPGQYLLVVKDQSVFQATYPQVDPIVILGEFTGSLSNGGERIRLDDANGNKIVDFEYNDQDPWPVRADGSGASLELILDGIDENAPVDRHYQWRGSVRPGGSPGTAGETPIGIVVNEVLTNRDSQLDAIELVNMSDAPVAIGGWYLSDSDNNFFKFQIPAGMTVQPAEYVVFDESDFNPTPDMPAANHFALNGSEGDDVWLVTRQGNEVGQFVDDVHFSGVWEDRTLGRVGDDSGRLVPTSRNTLGCRNRTWRISDVVISEVQFAPLPPSIEATSIFPGIESGDLEFIELTNQSNRAMDVSGWQITGGVEFELPPGTLLAAGQTMLIVPFDVGIVGLREAFLANYDASNTTMIVGGYSGSLNNSGETVQLLATDATDPTARVLVDEVVYDDLPPWQDADETGQSLSRSSGLSLGNAAASWVADSPSPGSADLQSLVAGDLTGDGILDGSDIDALFDAVAAGTFADELDLNGDTAVNEDDVTYLVESLMNSLYGDANLDGVVDVSDFGIWNSNKFTGCTGWATGDFNGDSQTDVSDFNIWNGRKFTSADSAAGFAGRESVGSREEETRSVSSTIDRVFEFQAGTSKTVSDFQR